MGFLGDLLKGVIDPQELSKALQPVLKEAEGNIAAAVSTALHSTLDRLNGAKITVTVELPAPKATAAKP